MDRPPLSHNTPDIPSLDQLELATVENAREALGSLKKTFDFWVAIARGLKVLKDKAERLNLGRKTFDILREREGLGKDQINKTRVSRLLAILDDLPAIEEWRSSNKLTDKQRFEWSSPEAI